MNRDDYKYLALSHDDVELKLDIVDRYDMFEVSYNIGGIQSTVYAKGLGTLLKELIRDVACQTEINVIGQSRTY